LLLLAGGAQIRIPGRKRRTSRPRNDLHKLARVVVIEQRVTLASR
jgi:hypothetical protein